VATSAGRPILADSPAPPHSDGPIRHARPIDRSIGELLVDLSDGTAELVRKELQLARTEAVESLMSLRRGGMMVGVAAGLGLCATGATTAFLILVLSRYVLGGLTWLASLIVAVVLGVVAMVCLRRAQSAFTAAKRPPHEAASSLKETVEWLKHPSRSAAT
jgi:hypothetical protein